MFFSESIFITKEGFTRAVIQPKIIDSELDANYRVLIPLHINFLYVSYKNRLKSVSLNTLRKTKCRESMVTE